MWEIFLSVRAIIGQISDAKFFHITVKIYHVPAIFNFNEFLLNVSLDI